MNPIYLLIIVLIISSCDRRSAVESDEFILSPSLFSANKITRATLYLRSYKAGEHYWNENELKKNAKSITVTGENSNKIWKALEKEVVSSVTRSATERYVNLPIIFENEKKEKYQIKIVKVSQKDKIYLFLSYPASESPRWIGLDETDFGGLTSDLLSFSRINGVDLR